MKQKRLLSLLFCAAIFSAAHSQAVKRDSDYPKFRIFIDGGLDYSLGASGTVLQPHPGLSIALPSASKGIGAGFDGAYFLTKNYGIGLKYRFFTANTNQISPWSEYEDVEDEYEYPIVEQSTSSFKEQTHVLGPAVYARWFLGQSKWNVSANAGVVYLYNKLSSISKKTNYHVFLPDGSYSFGKYSPNNLWVFGYDHIGATVGFTLSAGIRYQLTPAVGIGVSANGLFASLSQMKWLGEDLEEEYITTDVSRKISRIGISAGIDFSF
jgi:opacity protein-like surface antigen